VNVEFRDAQHWRVPNRRNLLILKVPPDEFRTPPWYLRRDPFGDEIMGKIETLPRRAQCSRQQR
jgi:hypothetical protein